MARHQKLLVKDKDAEGREIMREVYVLRTWGNVTGVRVYLHSNGIYGDKKGAPFRTREELRNLMGACTDDARAIARAMDWWDRFGNKIAEAYWEAEEKRLDQLQAAEFAGMVSDASEVDVILYQRRPSNKRSEEAYTEPTAWHEFGFPDRPDWWGHARTLDMGGWYYRRVELETDIVPTPDDPDGDKTSEE